MFFVRKLHIYSSQDPPEPRELQLISNTLRVSLSSRDLNKAFPPGALI